MCDGKIGVKGSFLILTFCVFTQAYFLTFLVFTQECLLLQMNLEYNIKSKNRIQPGASISLPNRHNDVSDKKNKS